MKSLCFVFSLIWCTCSLNAQDCLSVFQDSTTSEYIFATSLLNPSTSHQSVRPVKIKIKNDNIDSLDFTNLTYTYDEFGRISSKDIYYNTSDLAQREQFIYDDGKLLEKETYTLTNNNYILTQITKYLIAQDTLREIIFEVQSDAGFVEYSKYVFEYFDGLLIKVTSQNKEGLEWNNIKKDVFTYNQNKLLIDCITSEYDTSISEWRKKTKVSYTYREDNLISSFAIFQFIFGLWEQEIEYQAVYNSNSQLIRFEGYNTYSYTIYYGFNANSDNVTVYPKYIIKWGHFIVELSNKISFRAYFNNRSNHLDFENYGVDITYQTFSSIADELNIVNSYSLSQNYPNPFNPSTTINFSLPKQEHVTLKIYDILGKEVSTLVDEEMRTGNHTKIWNANNLSSGVYFYKLQAGNFTETKKMLLVR